MSNNKRTDFLYIVQGIILTRKDNIIGVSGVIGDAVAASYRIPKNMTARDAALDFCSLMIEGFGDNTKVPSWMVELKDPVCS